MFQASLRQDAYYQDGPCKTLVVEEDNVHSCFLQLTPTTPHSLKQQDDGSHRHHFDKELRIPTISGKMFSFIFYLSLLLPATVYGKDYFTAAVFEHRVQNYDSMDKTPLEVKNSNLQYYKKAVEVAAEKGADIILFNEYGTFQIRSRDRLLRYAEYVPDPRKQKFNPCTENVKDTHVLYTLSCLARENNIYIFANLIAMESCESTCDVDQIDSCEFNCPEDGVYFFNTDVVFDREGNIVARYRKVHPFFEVVNAPEKPEFETFETDFGKFGMVVCFDLVFGEAVLLAEKHGIDTLLYATYWYDDMLVLHSVEYQQSWAIANGVNVLAANTHAPGTGSLGSGIYSKTNGALIYTYEPDGKSKLLIANVPIKENVKIPDISSMIEIAPDEAIPKIETGEKFPENSYEKIAGPAIDKYGDYKYYKSQFENYTLTKLEKPSGEIQACSNEFCCSLSYSTQNLQEDFYLAAYSGLNHVKNYFQWCEEACVLTRCDPLDGKPCVVQPPTSKTVFQAVELKGNFKAKRVYPTVSKTRKRLAPKREWDFNRNEAETTLAFQSDSDVPLLKVGLLGRCYEKDPLFVPYYPTQFKKQPLV
ncbi:vascular non-inflammatory molecule 3 [Caerostris extrusa]|uniref:Vascular non-inflammatory molecule 3 n=1 Tax=Caerostris extrusa TaxID=172846 RepID=A0AAV4V8E8_CAEEX|nr:vascular non-inflammatory molecule 3 [Caerostris extrusa]